MSYAIMKLLHFLGFGVAWGASLAIHRLLGISAQGPAGAKLGLEAGARRLAGGVEIAGLFVAMTAGAWGIYLNPNVFVPKLSGAGPWIHVKLALVLVLLIVAHLRMFRLIKLVRLRESGGSEADCDALRTQARTFGTVDLILFVVIMAVATLRFVIFAS